MTLNATKTRADVETDEEWAVELAFQAVAEAEKKELGRRSELKATAGGIVGTIKDMCDIVGWDKGQPKSDPYKFMNPDVLDTINPAGAAQIKADLHLAMQMLSRTAQGDALCARDWGLMRWDFYQYNRAEAMIRFRKLIDEWQSARHALEYAQDVAEAAKAKARPIWNARDKARSDAFKAAEKAAGREPLFDFGEYLKKFIAERNK